MEEHNKLTTQQFWSAERTGFVFEKHPPGHAINQFIIQYIPVNRSGSCIEIGSYPGPFLTTFGDLGYILSGVDFNADNEKGLPEWLARQGYKTDQFRNVDFFEFEPGKQYDVVASFGFIEHFINYEEVITRHADLVKPGGLLLITTPNFKGFIQYQLHKRFDKENLSMHNVNSMQPGKWAALLKANGFEILFVGYLGGFTFWKGSPKLSRLAGLTIRFIERAIPYINKMLWFQSASFSAYCGIVARKKE